MNSNWSYSPETVKLGCDLCDLDLWPWPFAWTSLLSLVITPENFMMIRWWEHSQKGVTDRQTDGRTDGRTDWTIHRAAWSQLKTALWLWTRKITCYWGCTNWFNYLLLQLSKNYEDWIMQSYNLPVSSPSPLHKTQKQNFIPQKYLLTTVFSPFLFNLHLLLNKFWEIAAYIAILAYQWQKVTCREQDDTAFIGYFWLLHSP